MINIEINPKENFWEMNPQATILLKKVYEADTSPNKAESSKQMWAYCLLYHPRSILAEFAYTEKITYIREAFLYDDEWDPEEDAYLDETFKKSMLTRKQRILTNWDKHLDERDNFLNSISYEDNYEIKEKIMSNSKRIWDQFSAAESEVAKEKEQTSFGGAIESAAEQGKI